jgi:hypothetical protein
MNELFSKGHGLIIGVGADLPVTVQDATALYNVLVDQNRAAYPAEQVELLTESAADRTGIIEAFDQLISRANNNPESIVLVYFSGHGAKVEHPGGAAEYFLVPHGYKPGHLKTLITGHDFTNKIEAIKSKKLVVVLDCCHAGGIPALKALGENLVKSPLPPELLSVLESGTGRVVITSSREDEYSYTGKPYSIFTACLLEALAGKAAVKQDGFARILDILIYLFDQVPERAAGPQHPFVKKVLDLGDNFPLCYYAGGSKQMLGAPPEQVQPEIMTTSKLSPLRRKILEGELKSLETPYMILSKKIEALRNAFVIKADTAVKFQLEHELLEAESELVKYQNKMEEIEQTLQ